MSELVDITAIYGMTYSLKLAVMTDRAEHVGIYA